MPATKRIIDIVLATVALAVLWPILLLLALLVRLDSPGPALFHGERMGEDGRPFRVLKFRTMMQPDSPPGPDCVAKPHDPRITRLGAWLRCHKLDELPQLLNVLGGEMSLVGPRPEGLRYLPHYTFRQRRVLRARPGITGLSQLAYRDEGATLATCVDPEQAYITQVLPHKIELDLWYIDHWSLALDLRILARTAACLLQPPFVGRAGSQTQSRVG